MIRPAAIHRHIEHAGIPGFDDPDKIAIYTDGRVVAQRHRNGLEELWTGHAVGWPGRITLKGTTTIITP